MAGYEQCIEFLLTRRSIRRYEDREVPEDLIRRVLDAARFAPSARNRQPWRFVVVRDPEIRGRLSAFHRGARPLANAPLGIIVACDSEESPVSYQVDCANAAMYVMLAAHALGLGTVWIQALRDKEAIQRLVGLPENIVPVAIIAMGWPAEKPEPKPRKDLEELTIYV
jgi:nitroreductase